MSHNVMGAWSTPSEAKPWWVGLPDAGAYSNAPAANNFEAASHAGMLYEVEKVPIVAAWNGSYLPIHRQYANVRTDNGTVLGVVGENYRVFQNTETLDFLDTLTAEGLKMNSCGVLGYGQRVWFLGRVGDHMVIDSKKDDVVDQYICLLNGHDGGTTCKVFWTPIRVVCQNTERAALRGFCAGVNGLSIKHTGSLDNRLAQARNVMGLTVEYYSRVQEIFSTFNSVPVNTEQVGKFLDHMFAPQGTNTRSDNNRDDVTRLFECGSGNSGEDCWDLYNGYTEWYDHFRSYKETDSTCREENRLDAVFFGGATDGKGKAFEFIAEEFCGVTI